MSKSLEEGGRSFGSGRIQILSPLLNRTFSSLPCRSMVAAWNEVNRGQFTIDEYKDWCALNDSLLMD